MRPVRPMIDEYNHATMQIRRLIHRLLYCTVYCTGEL